MPPTTPLTPPGAGPDLRQMPEEHRLQILVQGVTDYAIYMLDPDGTIASWNSGGQKLKLYSPEEIIGQNFSRFFTEEDRQRGLPATALRTARETGRFEDEGWRVRKDGSRFWALAVINAIRDENGELIGFAKVTRDLSERRAAEQAALEAERRFRLLVENVVDYAIYMLDPSGMISNWNAGAERLKGYVPSEIVGQHFSRFYTREDRTSGLPARALETAAREGRYESEGWRVRKDGSRFWASVVIDVIRDRSGALLGFAKITRDITERQQAHEALRESERQFRLLVSSVTDYAIYMLDLNGVVASWNAGARRIKGYDAAEIIGQHFSRFYTDPDRQAGVPAQALRTATERGQYQAEGWRLRKDGSRFWAGVVINAIRDEDGTLVGFAKVTRDLSERRRAQDALEKAQAQLAMTQRLEALGQLAGGVAHDFNNLLMIVGGAAQSLKQFLPDDPKAARSMAALDTAVKRGASLTRQMLSFSGRRRLDPKQLRVKEWADAFAHFLSSSVPPRIRLVVEISGGVWPLEVDVSELELALVNLTLNARDAIASEGEIVVTAQNVTLGGETEPGLRGAFVAMTVTDSGSGVPPDVLPRIFEPFFTTKETGKGTGLGLSQVYGFCVQSGGGVTVTSEAGEGTQVTMYLPKAKAAARNAEEAQEPAPVDFTGLRVLIVEDNPEVSEIASGLFEQLGITSTVVHGAEAALHHLESGRSFDLLFSDLVMPGAMDGTQLAAAVSARYPALPVLLTTGYSKAADAVRQYPVLRKPYGAAELRAAVTALLRHAEAEPRGANLLQFPQAPKNRPS